MKNDPLPACLPEDSRALLVGRVWDPAVHGPSVVVVRGDRVIDITRECGTTADLFEADNVVERVRNAVGMPLLGVDELVKNSAAEVRDDSLPWLLAPNDVQSVKACGVTFVDSLLERLLEERAGGDASLAHSMRHKLQDEIGSSLSRVRPGSQEALLLRERMLAAGQWSQYLEVGLGPDAEVFTKAQPMSSLGFGARVGISRNSNWNNPEPEIVLAVNSRGIPVGAALGNDVNLRDVEGRSALLLGKAKDNNGSCAIGPFVRLFDDRFSLESVRTAEIGLTVHGARDDFLLQASSWMERISRDPVSLISDVHGRHHQYPDGFMLFLGTMFAPIQDRNAKGMGFTHCMDDEVTISCAQLGTLFNRVGFAEEVPEWVFGIRSLYENLRERYP